MLKNGPKPAIIDRFCRKKPALRRSKTSHSDAEVFREGRKRPGNGAKPATEEDQTAEKQSRDGAKPATSLSLQNSNEKRQRPMSNKNIYMGKINGGVAAYSDKRHDELASLLPGIEDETP